MEHKFRCNCPITVALDVIGDKWALVIVKQMLTEGKKRLKILLRVKKLLLLTYCLQD